jgi:hypothetical protein
VERELSAGAGPEEADGEKDPHAHPRAHACPVQRRPARGHRRAPVRARQHPERHAA